MKIVLTAIFLPLLISIIYYLLIPSPPFPPPPPGSLVSAEPADRESPYRRGYFTNFSRDELMAYYDRQFKGRLPLQFRRVIPPEDAFSVIRDQTQSSYLEEIVHPWRESLYVNAWVPTLPQEQINRNGIHYLNKVTVRFIPSHPITRLTVLLLAGVCVYLLARVYADK